MIIPFAAGGPTDVLGRIVGQRMSEMLGQQVVIENVGGAGGMTGSKRVADAQPDGYIDGHRHGRHPCPGPDALQAAALQFADRLHAGRAARPGSDRADGAQGSAGEGLQGVRRLRQGQPDQDAVRLGRRGLGDASRLRAAQLHPQDQHHAHPVPRHRPGDDRAAGRPHRLPVRGVVDREAAYRRRHRQGAGDLQHDALAGAAEPGDRGRAGHQGPDRLHLERDLHAEEHAGRRSSSG